MTFHRLAVVNRGGAAVRIMHAVRELVLADGRDLRTIALYTEPDRESLFVREADERHSLGTAFRTQPDGTRLSAYLDLPLVQEALVRVRADAVWAGWGYAAERPEFVELCEELGITVVGPSSVVMRRVSDKITAKRIAEAAAVPVAPWSGGPVETAEDAVRHAARLGYPVLVKAAAGSGGLGLRRIERAEDVEAALAAARAEAMAAFGDPTVFLEAALVGARQLEVPVVGDQHGTVWAVGVRDCTVQRHDEKVLDESPSPALDADQDRELRDAAVRLATAAGYTNVGTVEFLYDPVQRRFSFIEVNARLPVGHPVVEESTGIDLVKLQLHVAAGGRLEGDPPLPVGHAIGVRLDAEDAEHDFRPSPGTVEVLWLPDGPGVRVDTAVSVGDRIPPEVDPMVATIVAHGSARPEALARLRRALANTAVVIAGGTSNRAFLQALVARPELAAGDVDTRWVDRLIADDALRTDEHLTVSVLAAAIHAARAEEAADQANFLASAARGRPEVHPEMGHVVDLVAEGTEYRVTVLRVAPRQYRLLVDGQVADVRVERAGRAEERFAVGGVTYRLLVSEQSGTYHVEVNGVPHRVARDTGGAVRAAAPGVVVALLVEAGSEVAAGQPVAVLEAMKMESPVVAPAGGRVREVLVRTHQQVGAGEPLLVLEPMAQAAARQVPTRRVEFSALGGDELHGTTCPRRLRAIRAMILGWDVAPRDLERSTREAVCPEGMLAIEERRALEDEILEAFTDIVALFGGQTAGADLDDDSGLRRSREEYLYTYLRDPRAGVRDLPDGFVEQLRAALRHYGVTNLDAGAAVDEALLRALRSQQRMVEQTAVISRLLQTRLAQPAAYRDETARLLLDRIVAETRGAHPSVHDLAREVRFRTFDEPLLEEVRASVYREAEQHLDALALDPGRPDREDHVSALVACPQPLAGLVLGRIGDSSLDLKQALLEVMLRRYYRIRPLDHVRTGETAGRAYAESRYRLDDRAVQVLTTHAGLDDLGEAATALGDLVAAVEPGTDTVVDFYLWKSGPPEEPDAVRDALQVVLDEYLTAGLRRVVVALAHAGSGRGMSGVQHFTFRPTPEGYREERLYRALHPMMGKRLELWRLSEFDVDRLPSVEDVYLFRGVARTNPKDERLFVLAEVRDLTPVRDADGAVVALPEFERVYQEALSAIRGVQASLPPDRRLPWNRLLLYVWPPIDLSPDDLAAQVRRLAPETEGLGLEKVAVHGRLVGRNGSPPRRVVLDISAPGGSSPVLRVREPNQRPLQPLSRYDQKVVQLRRRGLTYPYELIRQIAPGHLSPGGDFPVGRFVEHDLVGESLEAVEREPGGNTANMVVGTITTEDPRYPEGITRVILLGDPSRGMGSLAEPECRRIIAALDLATTLQVPLEWIAVSAGALIAMDSGTENMDWIALVLRRIIDFTQAGGEINVVVAGINVGAQPYWNAEATMLMHTKGILVMTPDSAMVLTGKQALDYSGGVSAEDNEGIGGFHRVMGLNGQAQYLARDLPDACRLLLEHYRHTYVAPGERFPRKAVTTDPVDRDVRSSPHGGDFATIGEVFAEETNPGRKKPFEIRRVMSAVVDADRDVLERWFAMAEAETAVVWDAHLGGRPVCMLGLESKPLPRLGPVPADGPSTWTSGTLFPLSSKKVARTVNAASGNRPLVVLANLSGFDGSPESMRRLQLEYGAEIGRAVVNFKGPIVFTVVSRYHGGAFVVFSAALNESMEVAALEGAHASVIGGAPAAAVVFARDVRRRVQDDPRVVALKERMAAAEGSARAELRRELDALTAEVHTEKLGEVAAEFDAVHTVERALKVGSVHRIIASRELRPYVIDAVERGIAKELSRVGLPG